MWVGVGCRVRGGGKVVKLVRCLWGVFKLKRTRSFVLTVIPLENEEQVDSGRKRSNLFSRLSNLPWKIAISKSKGQHVCKEQQQQFFGVPCKQLAREATAGVVSGMASTPNKLCVILTFYLSKQNLIGTFISPMFKHGWD